MSNRLQQPVTEVLYSGYWLLFVGDWFHVAEKKIDSNFFEKLL